MKMKMDIVSREFIKPSSPTPSFLQDFKLSYLDQLIPPSYVPLILYYTYKESSNSNVTQSDMSHRLRDSLSKTLTQFYPLSGRMTKHQLSVDCSDQGVHYVEAHVHSRLSQIIHSPNIELLDPLLPHKLSGTATGIVRVEEQLAIQINMFQCGGIVIGICINHRIADICTLGTFLKAWAANAITTSTHINYLVPQPQPQPLPIFESASLFPQVIIHSSPNSTDQSAPAERIVTKRFVFTASAIAALKAKVVNSGTSFTNPTRVEVISAFLWKCGILAKTGGEKTSVALQVVNLRGRMVPPLKEHSFGNIFEMTSAITNGESTDLGCLVEKIRAAIGTIDREYIMKLLGENGFEMVKSKYMEIGKMMYKGDELFTFSSWCRFGNIYEADFGWGKPSWVSRASSASKNCVYLMDSTREGGGGGGGGGIEAWVVMNEVDMGRFEQDPQLQTLTSSFPSP